MAEDKLEKKLDVNSIHQLAKLINKSVEELELSKEQQELMNKYNSVLVSVYQSELDRLANLLRNVKDSLPSSFYNLKFELDIATSDLENGQIPLFTGSNESSQALIYSQLDLNEIVEETREKVLKEAVNISNQFSDNGLPEFE